ncbi:ABC-2 transporter permease [Halobacillus locisalis]|uniref:ABC-2 transporter permease n=1 Tax=Halobacillus locisalis TaxID=220753 RepID=A0A838CWV3_9BACI|nr:ABC-2 transporter permease [Halobacillus locisalis]MBA2176319.1 ABC-2 transporter permease [Halobacillus locisalis]
MYNLIRKDLVLQSKMIIGLMIGLCVYLFLDVSSLWVGVVFSIAVAMNAVTIDEKSSVHILLNSLPYTRKEIVSSKYIVVLLLTVMVSAAIYVGNLAIHGEFTSLKNLLFMIAIAVTAISVMLPFCYKFKSSYLVTASIVAFGLYLLVVSFFIQDLNDRIRAFVEFLLTMQSTGAYVAFVASIMILYVCSGLVSFRIYKNKAF